MSETAAAPSSQQEAADLVARTATAARAATRLLTRTPEGEPA